LALCKSAENNAADCYGRQTIPGFQAQYEKLESKFCNEIGIFCVALEARKLDWESELMKQPNIMAIGDNARVNYNSQDYSTNITKSKFDFRQLNEAIEEKISDQKLRAALKAKVAEMESNIGVKGAFRQKYEEFMALAANHVTALGPTVVLLADFVANHMK
jgi:hypothetical protein